MNDSEQLKDRKRLKARNCYGHLGGTLGNRLFDRMLALGWFENEEGKDTIYILTENGEEAFKELGVDIYEKRLRKEEKP